MRKRIEVCAAVRFRRLEVLTQMSPSKKIVWLVGAWLMLLAVYATVSFSLPRGNQSLSTFGNLVQCLVPL